MARFIPVDRDTDYLLPPSVEEWLPADHLARFVVEVVDGLDLGERSRQYAGRGSAAHHPSVLLALLIYGYATARATSYEFSDHVIRATRIRIRVAENVGQHGRCTRITSSQRGATGLSRSDWREFAATNVTSATRACTPTDTSQSLTQAVVIALGCRGGILTVGSKVPSRIPPYRVSRES